MTILQWFRSIDVFCYSVKSIYTVFTNSALIHFIQIFGSADDTVVGVVSMPRKFCFNSFTIHPMKKLFCAERNFIFSNVLRVHFRVAMTAFCFQELFGFKGRPNMFSFCCWKIEVFVSGLLSLEACPLNSRAAWAPIRTWFSISLTNSASSSLSLSSLLYLSFDISPNVHNKLQTQCSFVI